MNNILALYGSFINPIVIFLYWLIIVGLSIRILMKRKSNTFVIAWLLIIHIIPILGIILYLLFGEIHLGQLRAKRAKELKPQVSHFTEQLLLYPEVFSNQITDVAQPVFQLIEHQTKLGGFKGNEIQLLDNFEIVFSKVLKDIQDAKSNIEMTFYIWQSSGIVVDIESALLDAVKRGVSCRIMIDSAGGRTFLKSEQAKKMRQNGIKIINCLKVNLFRFFLRRLDLRQHRKIIIIDNHICYTGSMNMVDPRFFKQNEGVGEWVDIMVRMNGPITMMMGALYAGDWLLETGQRIDFPKITTFEQADLTQHSVMQLVPSGPGYTENMLQQSLLLAIYSAKEELIFTTPYFVPSDDILHAICTAAERGIQVKLVLPKKGDSLMTNWASRAFFTELLESGVQIYQFEHNLLHTKSILIDKKLSLVGTVNLDMRSLWLNFELTAVIDEIQFSNELDQLLAEYLAHSTKLTLAQWKKRPFYHPVLERIFYFCSPLL